MVASKQSVVPAGWHTASPLAFSRWHQRGNMIDTAPVSVRLIKLFASAGGASQAWPPACSY